MRPMIPLSKRLRNHPRLTAFARLCLWGDYPGAVPLSLVCWVFLRILGLVYLVAFLSFWLQLEGLVGDRGILPMVHYFRAVEMQVGVQRLWLLPTLIYLYPQSLTAHVLCAAGCLLALMVTVNRLTGPCLFVLWACYLSLLPAGQIFMNFQWDNQLLEAGFLAMFLVSWRWKPGSRPPTRVMTWLYRWFLFKLMFGSGIVKLTSGDTTWRDLSALTVHFETQPLPTWIGWYAHQLPAWFHKFSVLVMFGIELVVPFMIFLPRRPRLAAFLIFIFFQGLILLTGNYTYQNWLSMATCLFLLDDAMLRAVLPGRLVSLTPPEQAGDRERLDPRIALACLFFAVSGIQMGLTLLKPAKLTPAVVTLLQVVGPFRTINNYGQFAVMTTQRPELIIEGSMDGETWQTYDFKWKPGDPSQRPRFVAPHQPRLDWMMWFAAFSDYRRNPWVLRLMELLASGSPEVTGLFKENPFPDRPPRFVRTLVYEYRFTDFETRRETGRWWRRELVGLYCPTIEAPE